MTDKIWVLHLIARKKDNKEVIKKDIVNQKVVKSNKYNNLKDDVKIMLTKAKIKYEDYNNITWRFYISVDSRNIRTANRLLINTILDDIMLHNNDTNIKYKYMSLLMNKHCRNERYFLLDIDDNNILKLDMIKNKLTNKCVIYDDMTIKTPNGWHMVTSGFNPKLIEDIDNVEIKQNALLFLAMEK